MTHKLRALREANDLSQHELAFFVGCSHATISRVESGEIDISAALKARIARALKVNVRELWASPVGDAPEREPAAL